MDVIQKRRGAGEALVSHELFSVDPTTGLAEGDVSLARDAA
jgi:hypothetical protein